MRINDVVRLLSNREVVANSFLEALPIFFTGITVKEVYTEETTIQVTEDTDFLAVYPSQSHGDWFLVKSTAPRFTISRHSYQKAVLFNSSTNTVSVISVGPPAKRVIEVPPL